MKAYEVELLTPLRSVEQKSAMEEALSYIVRATCTLTADVQGGTPSAGTMGPLTKLDRGAEVCQIARK